MKIETLLSLARGERVGMGAWDLRDMLPTEELLWNAPTIVIEQSVLLTDVSFWQEDIDFAKMKAKAAGTIIRAGQRTWVDRCFVENWKAARAAGLPRGTYWFYDSREDPIEQAKLWHSLVKDDPAELVYVADFEESYGGPFGKKESLKLFVATFIMLMGIDDSRLVIYTGFYWWTTRVGNDAFFARFGLWLAWYAPMEVVKVPLPWQEPDLVFWQFTSSGPGFDFGVSSKEIDLNWFCCDLLTFMLRFDYEVEPGPIPGGSMWKEVTATSLYIRAEARAGSASLGGLNRGDWVLTEPSGVSAWDRLLRIRRGGTTEEALPAPQAFSANAYLKTLSPQPTIPGPDPDPGDPLAIVRSVVYHKGADGVETSTELFPK